MVSRGASRWTTLNSRALPVPEDKHRVLVTTTRQFDGLPTSRGWNCGGVRRGGRVGGLVVVVDLLLTNIVRIQTREFLPEGSHYPLPPPPCVACHSPRRHVKLQGRETHWHWATRSVAPLWYPGAQNEDGGWRVLRIGWHRRIAVRWATPSEGVTTNHKGVIRFTSTNEW